MSKVLDLEISGVRGAAEPCLSPPRQINILYIIDQLCTAGGAERALLKTIAGLPSDRFNPQLLTFRYQSNIEFFRNLPCPLHVMPLTRTYDWNALKTACQLRNFILDQQIDIVHTFHETSDIWGGLVAKWAQTPVLVSSRRDMGFLRSTKHRLAYRLMASRFHRVVTVSEKIRQLCITSERLRPEKVATIYNGISLTQVDSIPSDRNYRTVAGIPADSVLITSVGNIRTIKGFDILVRAAKLVCRQYPKAVFLLIGEESDQQCATALHELVKSLQLSDNFKLVGPRTDVLSLLKATDVFCLPSRSEGFSNALVEAMACGLPCVATDVGGNGEAIVDGANGWLVPPESAQALADGVLALIRDPKEARLFGSAARRTVQERFTIERTMGALIDLYLELLLSA